MSFPAAWAPPPRGPPPPGLAGLPTTGSNVFPGRVRPLAKGTAAALFIYSLEEDAAVDAMASSMGQPPVLARPLTLIVEGRVSLGGDGGPGDPAGPSAPP